jgi:hypothetical protein
MLWRGDSLKASLMRASEPHDDRQPPAALHDFDDDGFRVLALGAFKGPEIESRLTRLNPRQIHLRGAFWAPRAIIHVGVFRRIFELWHVRLPLIQAGVLPNSQPSTPGTRPLPVMRRPCAYREQIANPFSEVRARNPETGRRPGVAQSLTWR